ncbi:MAG: response regulator [Phycisphaerales bacterium JB039]
MPLDKEVLTTGEVAKLCNVAPRTVSKWFDSGALGGYRIPGSKDRRIPVGELMKFMKAHGIPLDALSDGRTKVLIVDDEPEITQTLQRVLAEQAGYETYTADSAFKAGALCEQLRPHVVLLDIHLSDTDARYIARAIQTSDTMQMTRVIAMSGKLTDGQAQSLGSAGFDGFLKKPFQVRQVVETIERATNLVH